LTWEKFSESFIPKKKDQAAINPIETRIIGGIIKQYKKINDGVEEIVTIVNPYELILSAESFIPAMTLKVKKDPITDDGTEIGEDTMMEVADGILPGTYKNRVLKMGIKPMGLEILDSTLTAWVERKEDSNIQEMAVVCNAKGLPDALWGTEKIDFHSKMPETKVISKALTGLQFHPVNHPDTPDFKKIDALSPEMITPGRVYIPHLINSDARVQFDNNRELFKNLQLTRDTKINVLKELDELGFDIYHPQDVIDSKMPEFFGPIYRADIETVIFQNE
jgi:hypothetical protein